MAFFSVHLFSYFSGAVLLTFWDYDKKPWFLPSLALCLELTGVWWSIFIAGQVRAASHEGEYGQTMAAFRVPRSVVTFFGMTTIGTALQSGEIAWVLSADTVLLFLLLALNIYLYLKKMQPVAKWRIPLRRWIKAGKALHRDYRAFTLCRARQRADRENSLSTGVLILFCRDWCYRCAISRAVFVCKRWFPAPFPSTTNGLLSVPKLTAQFLILRLHQNGAPDGEVLVHPVP